MNTLNNEKATKSKVAEIVGIITAIVPLIKH
jgi:hypothetical protein